MKEILVAFAAYNRDANRAFVTRLSTLDEGVLRAECGAYYKSLLGTLEHIAQTLGNRMKYKNYKGEELERPYWNLVFHILNHGTHHRGEISALLDQGGVANDFSGFNLYTK